MPQQVEGDMRQHPSQLVTCCFIMGLLLELWELHSVNGLDAISERLSEKPLLPKLKKEGLQTQRSQVKLPGKQNSSTHGTE